MSAKLRKRESKKEFRFVRNGRLTFYSFACGYIELRSTDRANIRTGDLYTELYHEGACYHVRQYDRRPGAAVFRVFWESYDTLKEARAKFDEQPGTIENGADR